MVPRDIKSKMSAEAEKHQQACLSCKQAPGKKKIFLKLSAKQTISYFDLEVNFPGNPVVPPLVHYFVASGINLDLLNTLLIFKILHRKRVGFNNKKYKVFCSDVNHISINYTGKPAIYQTDKLKPSYLVYRVNNLNCIISKSLDDKHVFDTLSQSKELTEAPPSFGEFKPPGIKGLGVMHFRGRMPAPVGSKPVHVNENKDREVRERYRGIKHYLNINESDLLIDAEMRAIEKEAALANLEELNKPKSSGILIGTKEHKDYLVALNKEPPLEGRKKMMADDLLLELRNIEEFDRLKRWYDEIKPFVLKEGIFPDKPAQPIITGDRRKDMMLERSTRMFASIWFNASEELISSMRNWCSEQYKLRKINLIDRKSLAPPSVMLEAERRAKKASEEHKLASTKLNEWRFTQRLREIVNNKNSLKANLRAIGEIEKKKITHEKLKFSDVIKLENPYIALADNSDYNTDDYSTDNDYDDYYTDTDEEDIHRSCKRVDHEVKSSKRYNKRQKNTVTVMDLTNALEICIRTPNPAALYTRLDYDKKLPENSIPKLKGRMAVLHMAKVISLLRRGAYTKNVDRDIHHFRGCTTKFMAGNLKRYIESEGIYLTSSIKGLMITEQIIKD
jgi:hypothetical protein